MGNVQRARIRIPDSRNKKTQKSKGKVNRIHQARRTRKFTKKNTEQQGTAINRENNENTKAKNGNQRGSGKNKTSWTKTCTQQIREGRGMHYTILQKI